MSGLSFSAAFRWMNCLGSSQMCKQIGRTPQSPEAVEGTQAHAMAAGFLLGEIPQHSAGIRPEQFEEMVLNGQAYSRLVRMLRETYDATGELHVEKRWTHPDNTSVRGDADVIADGNPALMAGRVLLVGDYKYGKGTPISAERNYQLMITAITRLRMLGRAASTYKGAVLFIHQPRSLFGDTFSSWYVDFAELVRFESLALAAAEASNAADASLTPGEWCRSCNAKVICPRFVEENLTPIADMPPLTGYSLIQLGPLLAKAKAVKQWIDDLDQHVRLALLQGHNVPGWKLSTRNGTRVWRDRIVASVEVEKLLGPKGFKHELLSPTQILQKYSELEETLGPLIDQPKVNVLLRD